MQDGAKAFRIEGHVSDHNLVFPSQERQAYRVAQMNLLTDDIDPLQRPRESSGAPVAVLHAVRHIQGNDDARTRLAELRSQTLGLLHSRFRDRQGQQQDGKASKQQQQEVPQTELPRTNMDAPVQELHGGPVRSLDPLAIQQVRQDRERNPKSRKQKQRIHEGHERAPVSPPFRVACRMKKNSFSTASSGREVSTVV